MSTFPMFSTLANNPFLASSPFAPRTSQAADVPEDAPEGSYTYALVKNGPDVPADECEAPESAVEIVVRWGDSLLHVAHLTPPRPFWLGEEEREHAGCDFFLPAEKLGGATRAPLVLVGDGGAVHLVVMPGATGTIEHAGRKTKIADVIASGACAPCAEVSGAIRIELPFGGKARLSFGDFTFEVANVRAGRAVAGRVQLDKRGLPFTALSMVLHLGLLGSLAVLMPPMAMADDGSVTTDQRYTMGQLLAASAERETEQSKEQLATSQPADNMGGTGARSKGDEGKTGSTTSKNTDGRWGIYGPKDNTDVRISRTHALRDAADFGMVGILNAGIGGDPNTLRAPWGDLVAVGNDPKSALGNMWGQTIDEASGSGGLGLTGVGEGGGGRYEGVGVGMIGTIGHGGGLGDGQGFGPGRGGSSWLGSRGHKVASPKMTVGSTNVSGRLPPEIIQRIVRQNFGRFRMCYENGLRNNPNLAGRVAAAFVIGRDGAVSSVQNGGSDLPDSGVVSCVVRSFYGLSFPAPDGGIVTVTYPILFTPGAN